MSAHVPHVYLGNKWGDTEIEVDSDHLNHLERVMRLGAGDPVSYTDGTGTIGSGTYRGGMVIRGEERSIARPARPPMAIAPPRDRQRLRFAVEKLAELGVPRLHFLRTSHGEGSLPTLDKVVAWSRGALEQSRGVWLMVCDTEQMPLDELSPRWVAHPGGEPPQKYDGGVIAIGPEGGFSDDEIPANTRRLDLGPTILRVETAAIVAAVSAGPCPPS